MVPENEFHRHPFCLGPALSWALKNGFYTCTCPPEIKIPTCTMRLSSKEQVRKQTLQEPLLIAVPLQVRMAWWGPN